MKPETVEREDDEQLAAMGHEPELKRNFSTLSMLGLAFAVLNSWTGLITAGICNVCIAASLAEFLSAYPTAGGQYHWVAVSWPKWMPILAWITGWINVAGWIALVATNVLLSSQLILGIIACLHPEYESHSWHQFLLYIGLTMVVFTMNAFLNSLLPLVYRGAFLWSMGGFVVVSITVLACASPNYNSASFVFWGFNNATGWPDGVAWLLGLLQGGLGVTAFDAVVHMIEGIYAHCLGGGALLMPPEIPQAARQGPRIMVWSVCIGTMTGAMFLAILLLVSGDIQDVIASPAGPLLQILLDATHSRVGAICLLMLPLVCLFFATLSAMTISSRMVFAFARDRGLPWSRVLARVDVRLGLPLNALALTCVVVILFGMIFLASTSAFNAIMSASIVALNLSYAMPIAVNCAQGRKVLAQASWRLPAWLGWTADAIALCYVLLTTVLFLFPPKLPVTGTNMNYCIGAFVIIVMVSVLQWLMDGRKHFTGPLVNVTRPS
ncbi:hypothetical protein CDD81_3854 [Ophiocordyceps australis]|uniref:Amino acid permease/ SLC12A domain-containing protein n=1 Tax=Ophiocordyceps australis TaxID=1399860 RepID=A0A2C5XUG7_9HYPO|nr:hypothetical protein CDD81_3854 [Ophiocordyceps australis]